MPTPQYYAPMPDEMQWLLTNVPFYSQWYRFWLFWRLSEGALPAARVDPDWPTDSGSVSALNDDLRVLLTQYIETQFADTPELLEKVVPRYPPLAKRILLDNGIWAATLKRDHVHLETGDIARITPDGIVMADGSEHEVDVIVYATGFEASRFLMPMTITGRGGIDLHEHWGNDARAYLGVTVAGFPNLFCLYGPNTNLVANGSIIFFSECVVRYIVSSVHLLLDQRLRAVDCRSEVADAYNLRVDEGNARMAWGASNVNSWYKNASGRVTQNWPFTLLEFWQRTCGPDPADYELIE
jgi:4-hydroxyacetophenone monooxygenase